MSQPERIGSQGNEEPKFVEARVLSLTNDPEILRVMNHLLKGSNLGLEPGASIGNLMRTQMQEKSVWASAEDIEEALWRTSESAVQDYEIEKEDRSGS